jgi:hypothetical protein
LECEEPEERAEQREHRPRRHERVRAVHWPALRDGLDRRVSDTVEDPGGDRLQRRQAGQSQRDRNGERDDHQWVRLA